jgi:hypothetical protein
VPRDFLCLFSWREMRCYFHAQSSEFAQDVGGNDGGLPF